ncbi:phosphate ABC transporter permease PstA [Thermodesulforhabdus norvegica]|uniref:Phosphate transport system permease protein PstA n=1 Tax=Thermodesulforhabdus norvegica TaxID=39841 RepID=A0A1I4VW81_9BACT|nr:phosphate ABC transporter permease PstA [Thermodesulforhabdus norvegica]SFN05521.1 phosphate transport system permease protein [Thermodesulforhabdus norvegica]
MKAGSYRRRLIVNKFMEGLIFFFAFTSLFPLMLILFYLARKGIAVIDWQFISHLPRPIGEEGGGVLNAIVGTSMLILCAALMAVPLGVGAGLYLAEARESRLSYWTRVAVDILQGSPSIVLGVVVYIWVVKPMQSFSAISGSIALAIMMLPMVIYSTEETLKVIPDTLKEAALALGVPYYKTILKVIIPAGMSGITTGILIGVARIAGETAPLLFTAFGSPFLNLNALKPVAALPLVVFNYAISPYPQWWEQAWGASLLLAFLVLCLNLAAKMGTRRWKVQF